MADVIGKPRDIYDKFMFRVEIDGILHAGFTKVTGLKLEVTEVEYAEGGETVPDKTPGRAKVSDITLEQGVADDLELYRWWKQVMDVTTGTGIPDGKYKRDVDIVLLKRDGTERQRWHLKDAWPKEYNPFDGLDAKSDEKLISSIVLSVKTAKPVRDY